MRTTPDATLDFRCCDTTWRVGAYGTRAGAAVERARDTVRGLEGRLNAFDASSAVCALARDGFVEDADVAAVVRRAIEYAARTGGAFDITRGALGQAVKAYIRGDVARLPDLPPARAAVAVEGAVVRARGLLDLNGIAKGFIVDRAHAALVQTGARGFVDGGGDIAGPTGPVAVEAPGSSRVLGTLDTRWNIATSGGSKRRRDGADHLYDPRSGAVGARHEQVTVLASRDCVEADVLATTLCVLPLEEGHALVESWPGVEALWVSGGKLFASTGFSDHVWKA